MELSQEKKTQIAACHGKGMTVKEIAKAAKLTEAQVDVFLQSIGKKPLYRRCSQKHNRLTEEQKQQLIELFQEGKGVTEISKITGINIKTVDYYKPKLKEKEPATAGTVTDSVETTIVQNSTVSISKDNTGSPKSQGILEEIRRDLLQIYENMNEAAQHAWDLGEMYQKIRTALKEGGNEDT